MANGYKIDDKCLSTTMLYEINGLCKDITDCPAHSEYIIHIV